MAEKQAITTMVIKVDLTCEKCRKKIKKVLCKIPQIQNQMYDKKANTVTITVLCCSPEKIKKKIYCKGGKAVKCIEIKKPDPPKPDSPKPKPKPKPDPTPAPVLLISGCCGKCNHGIVGCPCYHCYCRPTPPYFEVYRWPACDSWGGGCSCRSKGYYVCRCEYICDNNPSSCTIT